MTDDNPDKTEERDWDFGGLTNHEVGKAPSGSGKDALADTLLQEIEREEKRSAQKIHKCPDCGAEFDCNF